MRRVTVRWHAAAEQELADLWLTAPDRDDIERAANEIDQLLSLGPASKGTPFALPVLDESSTRLIQQRAASLPEDLRWLRCGPLEAFFTAHEDDCMAIVLHVRPRRR
jgi:hypothetical protein